MERGVEAVKRVVGSPLSVICTKRAREGPVRAERWAVGGETTVEAARWVVELTPPSDGRKRGGERG